MSIQRHTFIRAYIVVQSYLYCFHGSLGLVQMAVFVQSCFPVGWTRTSTLLPSAYPSSPSPRTRSLLFLSSVHGWEDVRLECGTWFVCGILGWPCDDIIGTSAPVLPSTLDTILLLTPELCQRSGWKVTLHGSDQANITDAAVS